MAALRPEIDHRTTAPLIPKAVVHQSPGEIVDIARSGLDRNSAVQFRFLSEREMAGQSEPDYGHDVVQGHRQTSKPPHASGQAA